LLKVRRLCAAGSESDKIEYLYDAAGKKVQKLVTEAGTPRSFIYLQGFQYKGKTLLFFPTAEGYVNYTPAVYGGSLENQTVITPESYNYVFNYKDHLGNIRLSYGLDPVTNALKIIEENHYYPFGLKHTNYSSGWNSFQRIDEKVSLRPGRPSAPLEYKYKYNGKEWQDELRLNLYDYHAMLYDPATGRRNNIDPMAESSRRFSPYSYAMNNPVFFIDPDGMVVTPGSQKEWNKQKTAVSNELNSLRGKVNKLNATAAAKGWSAQKLAGKIGDMNDRITSLTGTMNNLSTLEQSSQSYSLNKIAAGATGDTSYDPATGDVVISFGNTANFVHETTHAGQFESGDIAFDSTTPGVTYANDTGDEIAAYKAQYAYDPSSVSGLNSTSTANSFSGITVNWLQNLSDSSGNKIYAPGGAANTAVYPLNTNSGRADILKGYPNNSSLQSLPSNFTYKSITTLKFRK
jgi:RHS repeat-associated protein